VTAVIVTQPDGETSGPCPSGTGTLHVEHGHLHVTTGPGGPVVAVFAPGAWTGARTAAPTAPDRPPHRTAPRLAVGDVVQVAGGAVKAGAEHAGGGPEFGPDPLLAVVVTGRDEDGDVFVREILPGHQVPRARYVAAEHLRATAVR
jgi:hypothetical protein